jgi:hypothetical protein
VILFITCAIAFRRTCDDHASGNSLSISESENTLSFGDGDVDVLGELPKVIAPPTTSRTRLVTSAKGDSCNDAYSCAVDCGTIVKGCKVKHTYLGFLSDAGFTPNVGRAYINTCVLKRYRPASHFSWMKNQLITRAVSIIKEQGNMIPNQPKIKKEDNTTVTLYDLITNIQRSKEPIYNVISRLTTIYSSLVRLCHEKPDYKKRLKATMLELLDKTPAEFKVIFENTYLSNWLGDEVKMLHKEFNSVPESGKFYGIMFNEMKRFMNNFGNYSLSITGVPDECSCQEFQNDPYWKQSKHKATMTNVVLEGCRVGCKLERKKEKIAAKVGQVKKTVKKIKKSVQGKLNKRKNRKVRKVKKGVEKKVKPGKKKAKKPKKEKKSKKPKKTFMQKVVKRLDNDKKNKKHKIKISSKVKKIVKKVKKSTKKVKNAIKKVKAIVNKTVKVGKKPKSGKKPEYYSGMGGNGNDKSPKGIDAKIDNKAVENPISDKK